MPNGVELSQEFTGLRIANYNELAFAFCLLKEMFLKFMPVKINMTTEDSLVRDQLKINEFVS